MELALEKTTNTHRMVAKKIEKIHEEGSTLLLKVEGKATVTHSEHNPVITQSPFVAKYVQKEINPISKKIEDAND